MGYLPGRHFPWTGAWDDAGEGHNRGQFLGPRLSGSALVKFVMISICTVPPAEGISYLHPVLKGGQKRRRRAPCDRVSPFIDPGRVPPGVDAGQFSARSVAAPDPEAFTRAPLEGGATAGPIQASMGRKARALPA